MPPLMLFEVNVRWTCEDKISSFWVVCESLEQAVLQVRNEVSQVNTPSEIGSARLIAPTPNSHLILVGGVDATV